LNGCGECLWLEASLWSLARPTSERFFTATIEIIYRMKRNVVEIITVYHGARLLDEWVLFQEPHQT